MTSPERTQVRTKTHIRSHAQPPGPLGNVAAAVEGQAAL